MKSLMSYMLVMFAVLFWIFRVVVCLMASMNMDFMVTPFNMTTEIILLFLTIIAMVLIIKRNLAGGLIYAATYCIYFGFAAYTPFMSVLGGDTSMNAIFPLFISVIAIILSIFIVIDLAMDRTRATSSGNSKTTGWFYNTKDYERQLDERADKNHYKF